MKSSHLQAWVACNMVKGSPWSIQGTADLLPWALRGEAREGASTVAEALGGLAGWLPPESFKACVERALSEMGRLHQQLPTPGSKWTAKMAFLIEIAQSFRDAMLDGRSHQRGAFDELAFCVSPTDQLDDLDAARRDRGLVFEEGRATLQAGELIDQVGACLAGPGADRVFASAMIPELAQRLEMVRGIDAKIERFLVDRQSMCQMPGDQWGWGILKGGNLDPSVDSLELVLPWRFVAQSAGGSRSEFPWGLWLEWAMPRQAQAWGGVLGADWAGDLEKLKAIASLDRPEDAEAWGPGHKEECARVAARLEAKALSEATPKASKERKPKGL